MARILIIDDDDEVRRLFASLLRRQGFQTTEARDGREGLATHAVARADVVITDIVMPGMEGLETILSLLRATPGLPIIAISGVTNAALYLATAHGLGARVALSKPITPGTLLHAVRSALGLTAR
jgi:CheY-like chemotaxis protein